MNVFAYSPSQDYTRPEDHTAPTYDMNPSLLYSLHYTMNMSFECEDMRRKARGSPTETMRKNCDSTESVHWAQDGKILQGGTLITFRENEHDRVGLVRVFHFVEDPLNVAKKLDKESEEGRGEGEEGRGQGAGTWEIRQREGKSVYGERDFQRGGKWEK